MAVTSSVNNIDISISIVTGFMKIILKWGEKLYQSRVEKVFSKWGNYFRVGQKLFQS